MNLAFKHSTGSWEDRAIAWKTKSDLVHVELWMDGPRESATCFSSRAPGGTGYATIDLTNYVCIEINATQQQMDDTRAFCEGVGFKRYNWVAIIGFVIPWSIDNRADMTCSEFGVMWGQRCMGMFTGVVARKTSPVGLYNLCGGGGR